ncbi:MAG TPA: glycosyl hydrolase family 16 [Chloroflexi bacterium]|nr:glycosyl hydrolase family 16 [Chloroflexota bacterium]
MNKPIFLLTLLLIPIWVSACAVTPTIPTATSIPVPTATPKPAWTLIWSDEFEQPDGSSPSPQNWVHATGGSGWGNGELQFYTNDIKNAYIENNMLVMKVINEEYMGRNYTSARLNTLTLAQFTYGRIEVRAKLPTTQGIWPAIWMLPAIGSSPVNGEIDIMELIGKEPFRVYGTLHYGNPYENQGSWFDLPESATFDQDFHVFSIEWEENEIRWYVDGQMYYKANQWFTSQANSPYPAPFDKPFYILLNVAVGGVWAGAPDDTSVFPQTMLVDYVRVYQFR